MTDDSGQFKVKVSISTKIFKSSIFLTMVTLTDAEVFFGIKFFFFARRLDLQMILDGSSSGKKAPSESEAVVLMVLQIHLW